MKLKPAPPAQAEPALRAARTRRASRTVGARRATVALAVAAATAAATVLSGPAVAEAAVIQTTTCVDGGGTRWSVRGVWGQPYLATDGTTRVAMDYAGWTTSRAGMVPTDSRVRTFDGGGALLQDLTWSGPFDYASGTAYRARNPLNPPSAPGRAQVRVTLGVDGDGFGDCTVTLTQPAPAETSTPAPTPTPSPTPTISPSDRYENDVLVVTNRERTKAGLAAFTTQSCVDQYAEAQAAAMASQRRMHHQDLAPILSACRLSTVGENVAYGYADGTSLTAGWMASPGHKANILNGRFRLIGIGAAQDVNGQWYAAQVFGG